MMGWYCKEKLDANQILEGKGLKRGNTRVTRVAVVFGFESEIPESNDMKPVQSSFNATRKLHLFGGECSAVHMLQL